jgi:predicted N-acyltransferase
VIEVRAVRSEDQAAWDRIASSSDDAWLSHSWEWNSDVEERAMGGERRSLVVLRAGQIVGIVPQHMHTWRRGPFRRRFLMANYWAGGGTALDNALSGADRAACFDAALRATHDQAHRDGVDKLLVFLPPLARRNLRGEAEARRALADGFTVTTTTAYVLRLAGRQKDEIWAAMEGRARTKARKAEKSGVCVVEASGGEAIDTLYPLHLETCRRTGASPYARSYFEATLASDAFHTFFARLDGTAIGALTLALYAGRALFDVSASLEAALRTGANNMLIWHAIKWLVDAKAEAFELGVLPDPGKRVRQKLATIAYHHRGFGGEEVSAYSGQLVYRRAPELLFEIARKITGRMDRAEP